MPKKFYRHWTAEDAVRAVHRFVNENKRFPTAREMKPGNRLPNRGTFYSLVGMSFYKFGEKNYPDLVEIRKEQHQQNINKSKKELSEWTAETLFSAIEQFAEEYGRLPYVNEYTEENGLPAYIVYSKFATEHFDNHLKEQFHDLVDHELSLMEDESQVQDGMIFPEWGGF